MIKRLDVTAEDLWEHVQETLTLSANGYILFDDTVLDKRHSSKLEMVYKQYSGNEHREALPWGQLIRRCCPSFLCRRK
jgi:hypothetical protein